MTAFSRTEQGGPTDSALAEAAAAATAAATDLPTSQPLTPGPPSRDPSTAALPGMAVHARFTGAVQGEVVAVVGPDLVAALQDSPMGPLDLAVAVRPALQSAAGTLGPVVLDPPAVLEPAAAVQRLADRGDPVYVPLLDGQTVRAAVAVLVTGRPAAAAPAAAAQAQVGTAPAAAGRRPEPPRRSGLDLLHDVEMEVTAELGRTRMSVRELLSLTPGAIVELDRTAGSPADLLVNGRLIARGEVVVVDETFGLRITEIVAPGEAA